MLKHYHPRRAVGFINTTPWPCVTPAHFYLLLRLKETLTCCSSKDLQSVCHRGKGWLLMELHARPYPNLFPSLSYHLKPPPPQYTCFLINNTAKAVANSDTICCSGQGSFSSGALVGLKPLGTPFRSIHFINHPQPALLL